MTTSPRSTSTPSGASSRAGSRTSARTVAAIGDQALEQPSAQVAGRAGDQVHIRLDSRIASTEDRQTPPDAGPVNVADYERLAHESLDPGVFGYFAGRRRRRAHAARQRRGVRAAGGCVRGRSWTSAEPIAAHDRARARRSRCRCWSRRPRSTGSPIPTGRRATARAAAAAGTIMCLSSLASATPAEVAEAAPGAPRWFQLYCFKDDGVTRALVDSAVAAGYEALVLTVDAPGEAGRRERDLRTGFRLPDDVTSRASRPRSATWSRSIPSRSSSSSTDALTWDDLDRIAGLSDLPVLVKGVMTEEDARLACEAGAAGVVVSNHGGRQLDGVRATIDVAARGGRSGRGPGRGADGRRHPARDGCGHGARARRARGARRAARCSGGWPPAASRACAGRARAAARRDRAGAAAGRVPRLRPTSPAVTSSALAERRSLQIAGWTKSARFQNA